LRALVQRVRQATVSVQGETLGSIELGLVLFIGVGVEDTPDDARYLVERLLNLRIFADEAGRFNRSALEVGAGLLAVSQFTLYADTRRGRRPSFTQAAPPAEAEPLFIQTVELLRQSGLPVATGRFGAEMRVALENDGPVTFWMDSADRLRPRRARAEG
jgi:D-tyrosyl-tRNA(Tyr) deacylase